MTQAQMVGYLVEKIGINKKQAKLTLDEISALVVRELKKEGSIRFAGLGIFRKRKLKARMGRNPATGEQIKIPARTRLRFTPAKALKDSVLGVTAAAAKSKPVVSPSHRATHHYQRLFSKIGARARCGIVTPGACPEATIRIEIDVLL
jgi:DNA-binding protein HU-beta